LPFKVVIPYPAAFCNGAGDKYNGGKKRMALKQLVRDLKELEEAEAKFLKATGWEKREGGWTCPQRTPNVILAQEGAVKLQRQLIARSHLIHLTGPEATRD
jgi:hypothetical protein